METSWVNLCLACWGGVGLLLFILIADRAVYSLLNAKKLGEKPDKIEEE